MGEDHKGLHPLGEENDPGGGGPANAFDMPTREAATLLGVTRQTVKNMLSDGRLRGDKVFDTQSNVEAWMVDGEQVKEIARERRSVTVSDYGEGTRNLLDSHVARQVEELKQARNEMRLSREAAERRHVERMRLWDEVAAQRGREYEQREKTNELLEKLIAGQEQSGLTLEEINEKKDEGLAEIKEERPGWFRRLFLGE